MPQQGQITAKEHYYDWYKDRNNTCCYKRLILENSIKIIKTKIKWKTDEGWSNEWCSYYKTVGYKIFTYKKARVIEIRNQKLQCY